MLDPPKPPREGDGEPKYPHRPKPFMRSLASLFTRKLRQLRREFDGAMEEKIVSEYYGGKEGSVCRGVVTAVGGERRRDAIVQLMPGFVRAGLPEALQCPHDDPQVGQVRLGAHSLPVLRFSSNMDPSHLHSRNVVESQLFQEGTRLLPPLVSVGHTIRNETSRVTFLDPVTWSRWGSGTLRALWSQTNIAYALPL